MGLRQAYLKMIHAFPGGADSMAAAVGFASAAGLSNRIYEIKGQRMHVDTALAIQAASGTTHFAEAVAKESGGAFFAIPVIEDCENDELLKKFTQILDQLGQLAKTHSAAIEDGVLDDHEEADLQRIASVIHSRVEELLALTARIYKPTPAATKQPRVRAA